MLIADLSIRSGKQQGKSIRLPNGKFLIGRGEDCQLKPNSDLVSRHHCNFMFDGIALRLKDLGSTNGTFVNGEQIRTTKILQSGDRVLIGKLEFEVMLREAPAEQVAPNPNPEIIEGNTDPEVPVTTDSATVTMLEMPVYDPPQEQFSETQVIQSAETMTGIPTTQPQPANPPAYQPMAYDQGYPMNPYGQPNPYAPMGMPMGYPQQPMMPQMPMGYNPQFGGYPQQYPYPQYPAQMPMGYPQYPAQMPQMGMAPQQQAPAPVIEEEPAPVEAKPKGKDMTVKLPDPKETGIKAPPPPDPNEKQVQAVKPEEKPSNMAADILRNMVVRKPNQ